MTPEPEFRTGVISPVECIKEGWALIKDQYWLFFGISLVAMLIGGAVPIVLLGPMMCGVFICLLQRQRNESVEFGTLFKGFDYFVQGLIVAVIKVAPMIVVIIPFYIIMMAVMMMAMPRGNASSGEAPIFVFGYLGFELVFVLVITVVSIGIEILFMFAFPLVVDRNMSGLDAAKLSIRAGRANLGGVLGLLLLNALLGIVGVFCCFVGVYLYLPVSFAATSIAYRRVFPAVPGTFGQPPPPPPPASWA